MNSWCKERTGKTLQELDIIIEQEVAFPVNKDELSKLVALHD
jgi:transposase